MNMHARTLKFVKNSFSYPTWHFILNFHPFWLSFPLVQKNPPVFGFFNEKPMFFAQQMFAVMETVGILFYIIFKKLSCLLFVINNCSYIIFTPVGSWLFIVIWPPFLFSLSLPLEKLALGIYRSYTSLPNFHLPLFLPYFPPYTRRVRCSYISRIMNDVIIFPSVQHIPNTRPLLCIILVLFGFE